MVASSLPAEWVAPLSLRRLLPNRLCVLDPCGIGQPLRELHWIAVKLARRDAAVATLLEANGYRDVELRGGPGDLGINVVCRSAA
jgi:hypothetical protein